MRYGTVLFDADDTLFDYARSERHALTTALADAGIACDERWLQSYRTINQQLWNEYERGIVTLAQLRSARFTRLFTSAGAVLPFDAESFSETYVRYLGEGSFLLEDAVTVIRALQQAGVRLAVITNGIRTVQLQRIARSELADAFEHIIVSEDTGFQKPHAGIFRFTLERLGLLDKDGILMVGDSLSSDIAGGIGFGIDTCWYNPLGAPNDTPFRPTYEIQALSDLLPIIIVD